MPSRFLVESLRTADARGRFPGSVDVPCYQCKEDVQISSSTKSLLEEGAQAVCTQCQQKDDRPRVELVLEESIDELERYLNA